MQLFFSETLDPCSPSPCGPNSKCRVVNDQAVCTCLPEYRGIPPSCRPECIVNAECPPHLACVNKKCADPCPNTCGLRAQCITKNHNPICTCPAGFTGDPFTFCSPHSKHYTYFIFLHQRQHEYSRKFDLDKIAFYIYIV